MSEIRFYFDFGSPNAYLSHRLLPDIAQRTGASLRYVPILLGGLFKMTGSHRYRRSATSRTSSPTSSWKPGVLSSATGSPNSA